MNWQQLLSLDPIFWVLIILSIVSLAVSLANVRQWLSVQSAFNQKADADITRLIGQPENATNQNVRHSLIAQYWRCITKQELTATALEKEVFRLAKLAIKPFNSRLKVLEVIAAIAPLIGLLGTVLGMVEAFKAMELAGAQVDPAVLSGGIWKALSTTAAGLVIAIPTFVAHSWFEAKAVHASEVIQNDLEQFLTQVALITRH